MFDLTAKVVVITGSTRGIGLAIATSRATEPSVKWASKCRKKPSKQRT
jgi:NAD(P)-dependent dehydrogenase (short-subunit alcohol dehydrogenase family)